MRIQSLVIAVVSFALLGEAAAQGVGVGASLDVVYIPSKTIKVPESAVTNPVGEFLGPGPVLSFAAKCICGEQGFGPLPPPKFFGFLLTPGTYRTAINIHNPNPFPVRFTKKALLTKPQSEKRGKVGQPVTESLGPDEGLEVDCSDFLNLLFGEKIPTDPPVNLTLFKGFVVITSKADLDVVGVYTYKNIEVAPPGTIIGPPGNVVPFPPPPQR